MRIPKGWVPILANEILGALLTNDLIEVPADKSKVKDALIECVTEELMVEDRLNQEVRNLLNKFEAQIDQGGADYRRLFDLTKQKLVKERDIIL